MLDAGCGPGWLWADGSWSAPRELQLALTDLSAGTVVEARDRVRSGLPGLPGRSSAGRSPTPSSCPSLRPRSIGSWPAAVEARVGDDGVFRISEESGRFVGRRPRR